MGNKTIVFHSSNFEMKCFDRKKKIDGGYSETQTNLLDIPITEHPILPLRGEKRSQ